MSKTYLMTLRPLEAYFLGNEKTFSFGAKDSPKNQYFIKSERMPMQTTLLGTLRYILMPIKHASFCYTKEEREQNDAVIGRNSFNIEEQEKQEFGIIQNISPVFLVYKNQKYVRTPFDHNTSIEGVYTPFKDYTEVKGCGQNTRLYTEQYNAKQGVADSYMNIVDGTLVKTDDIFDSIVRVGVNQAATENGFFKKQYSVMKEGWSFGCYVTLGSDISDKLLKKGTSAYLGQNKSVFHVQFQEDNNSLNTQIAEKLHENAIYCLGDALVSSAVYQESSFALVQLRDYRAYRTTLQERSGNFVGEVQKGSMLYKLVCAGSVFLTDNKENLAKCFKNENCEKIGFNSLVTTKKGAANQ